ncbi:MAG TPA: DUF58 domain-containing protein [Nevskiaceae bacterium]
MRARWPRTDGPVTLVRRRIFILPTRFGLGYGGLLVLMLVGAINYGNSMAFILTFLLAGLGFVVMHHTHANLVNLKVLARPVQPVFAGQPLAIELELSNPSRRVRYTIKAGWPRKPVTTSVDIPAGRVEPTTLILATHRRGWLAVPRFAIYSEFPLGLFRAWARVELDQRALVYPRPRGDRPPPRGPAEPAERRAHLAHDDGDFAGLRTYRTGDPLRSIHWKSLARHPVPAVKLFNAQADDELWLDWNALPQLDTEARLSQLARWVVDADAQHRAYGLRLPGTVITAATDAAHRDACLKALALFDDARA